MLHSARRQAAEVEIRELDLFVNFEWHDVIDSTNKYLGRSLRSDTPIQLPALVVAEKQSAGVGRGGNQWYSPDGCLMFSMAVPLKDARSESLPLDEQSARQELLELPLRVGYAIAIALKEISRSSPMIKWPNDVYIEDRKVAGVLIETVSLNEPQSIIAIIGIGINCRVDFQAAESSVQSNAVSLHEVARESMQEQAWPESVLVAFLHQWRSVQERQKSDPNWLHQLWPNHDWLFDKLVEIRQPHGTFSGRAMGIDSQGALVIQDITGSRRSVLSGTVRVLE